MNIWGVFAILVTLFAIMCIIGMEHLSKGGQRDISKHTAAGSTVLAIITGILGFDNELVAVLVIVAVIVVSLIIMMNRSDQRK